MSTILEAVQQVARFIGQVNRYVESSIGIDNRVERAADIWQTGSLHRQRVSKSPVITFGRIVESQPAVHAYKVQLDGLRSSAVCTTLTPGSVAPWGPRPLSVLLPGTRVQVLLFDATTPGLILGAAPPAASDARLVLAEAIGMASRCGVQVDKVFNYLLTLKSNSFPNYGGGRPFDSLPGDQGWLGAAGVGMGCDEFMAWLRAGDETCGIWAFLEDQWLRIAGHNLEVRAGGSETTYRDDEGEFDLYHGVTPYPAWEALGGLRREETLHRSFSAQQSQIDSPHYAPLEPDNDDQQPFHRWQEYQGRLGNLVSRFVSAPPRDSRVWRYGNEAPVTALLAEHYGRDGRYDLSSSRGISLRLKPAIVLPKRVKLPEDPTGDNNGNYAAAGVFGTGSSTVPDPASIGTPDDDPAVRLLGLTDYHAFGDWSAARMFALHKLDFKTPAENELPGYRGAQAPTFSSLANEQRLPPAGTRRIWIDHLLGEIDIVNCFAYIDILPDGCVAIGGGGYEELRFEHGNITLSCPGDIRLLPGRNLVGMAGRDAILKARNSADISATQRDVRIKAGGHMQVVAGVNGQGALLLESKAPSGEHDYASVVGEEVLSSGVIVKSVGGAAILAEQILIKAGVRNEFGTIMLDAGMGTCNMSCGTTARYIRVGAALDVFGEPGQAQVVNSFSRNVALIGTSLGVKGGLGVDGLGIFRKHVATLEQFSQGVKGGLVGYLEGESEFFDRADANNYINQLCVSNSDFSITAADEIFSSLTPAFYGEGRIGNPDVLPTVGFSFRSPAQYHTEAFAWPEARWQQAARLHNESLPIWLEQPITAGSTTTYPYPGPGDDGQVLKIYQQILVDPVTNVPIPAHLPAYLDGKFGKVNDVDFATGYMVIP